jgi:hypothetical protein
VAPVTAAEVGEAAVADLEAAAEEHG